MIAIDLGSNTIRFIEYDGIQWGKCFEKIVKTAESLNSTQKIGDPAVKRIIGAIEEAREKLDFDRHEIVAVTTAAMRLASNSHQLLQTIYETSGIRFTIIDAEEEASLTLRAVRYRLQQLGSEPKSFVMADIGGGSTELIGVEEGEVNSVSLNIGIVTLSESADTAEILEANLKSFEKQVAEMLTLSRKTSLVLTAGTPTTIAAYLLGMDYESYDPERINGYRLSLSDCLRAYNELMLMDETRRIRYVGVGRERLIAAGILMVSSIYTALGYDEAIVVDDGLREGVALSYYGT